MRLQPRPPRAPAGPPVVPVSPVSPPLRRTERGASELFILLMMTTMLAFAGLAYDAGMAFNARRHANNVASAAARAGANEVEPDALYTIGIPLLDESNAVNAARNRVALDGLTVLEADVEMGVQMRVKVQATHETTFLQVIGIGSLTVEAEAKVMAESLAAP